MKQSIRRTIFLIFSGILFLCVCLFNSGCQKEISEDLTNGPDSLVTEGVWLIKKMEVKSFYDTSLNRRVGYFFYDSTQRTITFLDTNFYQNNPADYVAKREVHTYDTLGFLKSFATQTAGQPFSYSAKIFYNSLGLPDKFEYKAPFPGVDHDAVFTWTQSGSNFYGIFTDPSSTSTPYSFGDRRFTVNANKELEELVYISQDTANYGDAKELTVRNADGEVIGEKNQYRTGNQYITEDSVVYERDYAQPTRVRDFYFLWSGKLQWYNDGYDIGFTRGLTGYSDIFEFDKHIMTKKTRYVRNPSGNPAFTKEDEETMQIEYDSNKNPVRLIQFYEGIKDYEITIVWQKVNW